MIHIEYSPNTQNLSSMKVSGGSVKMLVNVDDLGDLENFIKTLSDEELKEIMIIGDGTNSVFVNDNKEMILVRLN